MCGGTILSPTWVLTARHCVTSSSYDVMGGDILPGRGQRRSSRRVIRKSDQDLALIELSSPFDLDSCFNVPNLPQSEVADRTQCWITGWGRLGANSGAASTLMQAQTNVVPYSQCRSQMGHNHSRSDVCVLGNYNGRPTSACYGDSGGPLVCQTGAGFTLYGATSWGRDCRGISVYAGVYSAMSWIRSYVTTPSPTPTPTPPSPTPPSPPTPTPPTGSCEHEKDCSVSAWCNDTSFEQWCRNQGQLGHCPAPYCRQAGR